MENPLKWKRVDIIREFGMDSRTVGKRMADAGHKPDAVLTTKQVLAAMVSNLTAERTRKEKELADKYEIENKQSRRELVPVKAFSEQCRRAYESSRAIILSAANLEDEDKDKILLALRDGISSLDFIADGAGGDPDSPAAVHGQPVG